MSEAATETRPSSNGRAPRQSVTIVDSGGAGPEAKTPLGTAPIIPLLMVGIGAYLIWFMAHYWRQTGANVWPSAPIKSVLQGKGIQLTASSKAPPTSASVTAYEQGLGAGIAQQEATASPAPGGGGSGGGGGGPGPPVPPNASETFIIRAILARIGAPQTSQNINSMAAWIRHETPWPPVAKFNPMNTTLNEPGATNYNSVGVKNYTSWAQGIEANAATLLGGYPCLVGKFRSGAGICGGGCGGDLLKWSGNGYSSVC